MSEIDSNNRYEIKSIIMCLAVGMGQYWSYQQSAFSYGMQGSLLIAEG